MSHAAIIAQYLADVSGNALTMGTNLFVGSEPKTPANVVTVYDTGGPAPNQTMDGRCFICYPTIQIRVRHASFLTGDTQARALLQEVRQITHQTLSGTRYLGVFANSETIHLGKIDTNAGLAHVWASNFRIILEE